MEDSQLFDLSPRHREVREIAREVAAKVAPFADEADEAVEVHQGCLDALRESGLARYVVQAAYGGHDEVLDPLTIAVVREQLMYSSAHLDSMFGMQGVGSYSLSVGGSEALKQQWLPKVATLDAIAGLALTEPDVGSDLRAITTTMVVDGDELVVNGRKSFITNGGAADFYCTLVREEDGWSMVLVPASTPGLSIEKGADLMAPHILGELTFEDVRVPADHRLGVPGKAFSLMLQTLAVFRVTVAGSAVGLAQAALDEAKNHAMTREQFGKPLIELGAVSQKLAQSWTDVEAARAFVYRAAALAKSDPLAHLDYSSMAKVHATESAAAVVDRSVQTMGRFGLVRGSKIERLYRNARPLRVYEGATEVLLDSLARRLAKGAR
ncbi:acyl-CoA dehydrogenase [Nocardioides sp. 616]|uniref:acyl-CoA dehydrogenase family protein n=1 Tax=Nocardioides sp. 616 TaxID=2268090 RepID=UPI00196297A9|nr:acyl-CoA dehydrogenase [Nocardioides sp. 616]